MIGSTSQDGSSPPLLVLEMLMVSRTKVRLLQKYLFYFYVVEGAALCSFLILLFLLH